MYIIFTENKRESLPDLREYSHYKKNTVRSLGYYMNSIFNTSLIIIDSSELEHVLYGLRNAITYNQTYKSDGSLVVTVFGYVNSIIRNRKLLSILV